MTLLTMLRETSNVFALFRLKMKFPLRKLYIIKQAINTVIDVSHFITSRGYFQAFRTISTRRDTVREIKLL